MRRKVMTSKSWCGAKVELRLFQSFQGWPRNDNDRSPGDHVVKILIDCHNHQNHPVYW